MSDCNRYGLSRMIPAPVKREVRRRCGFGCVVCGAAIHEYHHLDPSFSEARSHDPAGIVLLCCGCHGRLTKGVLSEETVRVNAKSPKCLEAGFSWESFDVGDGWPTVVIGKARWVETRIILRVYGEPLIRIEPPERSGGPYRLSALLFDSEGEKLCEIVENEWRGPVENWDIEFVGPRVRIRRGHRDIALQLRADPPVGVVVERLDMFYKGARIWVDGDCLLVTDSGGRGLENPLAFEGVGAEVGIDYCDGHMVLNRGGRTSMRGGILRG